MALPAISPFSGSPDFSVVKPDSHSQSENKVIDLTPEYSQSPTLRMQELDILRKNLFHQQETTLWEVLDKARLGKHTEVVTNKFLLGIFKGNFCESAFMKYLVNLQIIHSALETCQQVILRSGHEHLKGVVVTQLFRSEGIKKDLKQWEFVAAEKFVPWSPYEGVVKYAENLVELAKTEPEIVVAHLYVWLGTFMSGGLTSRENVRKKIELIRSYEEGVPIGSGAEMFSLKNGDGTEMTTEEVADFKKKWHLCLSQVQDKLPQDKRGDLTKFQERIGDEVNKAFSILLEMVRKNVEPEHC